MHWAARGRFAEVLHLLLGIGANVLVSNKEGFTPLHFVLLGLEDAAAVTDASTDANDSAGCELLRFRVMKEVADVVNALLHAGVDTSAQNSHGKTAEDMAAAAVAAANAAGGTKEDGYPTYVAKQAAVVLQLLKEDAIHHTSAAVCNKDGAACACHTTLLIVINTMQ